jgi:UDP-2-acetamido-2,6-beta-L-arabino-hexul-4-ose reductase
MIKAVEGKETRLSDYCYVPVTYKKSLGEIVDLIYSFKESRKTLSVVNTADGFESKLYATYLSYLPKDKFSYPLVMHTDNRGSFTEILRTASAGQFSVNISKPGITKGNHWHNTKNEKFVVVKGKGVIRFRKPDETEIIEYYVSGDEITVVDIPTGYTHSIVNLSEDEDMITFMWCNECFNPDKPDTFIEEV